ncbi:MAG TPA: cupin domain-containing protein [Solirubrobacteraceae bacterium]|nr:cupin domain-containing protein [Solirubrobacteraceae bacterium]
MSEAVVVRPGEGVRVGNVEFLALSEHSPRFNLSIITMAPHRHGPPAHVHGDEDDAFLVLDGELTFLLGEREVAAPAGTFVLVPPGVEHTFENRTDTPVRIANIHAPAGFDRRLLEDG